MFQIPGVPITAFTQAALQDLIGQARTEYAELFAAAQASRDAGTLTSGQVDVLAALNTWVTDARAQLATFAASTPTEGAGEDPAARLESFSANTGGTEPNPEPTPGIATVAGSTGTSSVTVHEPAGDRSGAGYLTASASLGAFGSGQRLTLEQAGEMLDRRIGAISSLVGVKGARHSEALFRMQRADNPFVVDGSHRDASVLDAVCDEHRLEGGSLMGAFTSAPSLTASSGWCAPSETDWTIRTTYSPAGTLSIPTVSAPRGGLFVFPELAFTTVNGGYTGTNFFNLTEAQVAAGVPKTFVEINCPTPEEHRLDVDGVGIIGNLLALRGFPEYSAKFIAGAMIALTHWESTLNIAAIILGSTAVDLSTDECPWINDGTVFTQTVAAVDMAATDIRNNKRMANTATMECVLPEWWLADARADLMRRVSANADIVWADAMIRDAFARINVVPQFVKGYQDAYAVTAGTVGAAAAITQFPTTLKFLVYVPGTWVLAQTPVIDLSTVYDATRLANNQDLELFHEVGRHVLPRLAGSREYTIDICPSGGVGAAHTIKCSGCTG